MSNEILPSSPFYLHPNENPSLILVQPILEGRNYHAWARSFRMALLSKNKEGFVDGTISMPVATDRTFEVWRQCNNMVFKWILNSVSSTIGQSIMWMNTAREVWEDLSERFCNGDIFRLSDLIEEMYRLKQGELTVNEYYTKHKMLSEEYLVLRPLPVCSCNPKCTCGAVRKAKTNFDADCVIRFLRGLNDNFGSVKGQVPLMTPLPTVNKVFGMALKCETQFNYGLERPISAESSAMAAKAVYGTGEQYANQNFNRVTQGTGRGTQNFGRGGSQTTGNKRFQCVYCGRTGHTIERCYQRVGFPPGLKNKGRGETRVNQAYVENEEETTATPSFPATHTEFSPEELSQAMQLWRMMQQHHGVVKDQQMKTEPATALSACFSGTTDNVSGHYLQEDDWTS